MSRPAPGPRRRSRARGTPCSSRLRAGTIQVNVEGYASATGKGQLNQDLSGRRADKVIKLLKDELGSSAKINRFAHGEDNPAEKKELEDQSQRRVEIWF